MSTIELTGVETEPLVLRTIYFERSAAHGREEPRRLEDVEYALRQLRHLLVYAGRMSRSVRDEDVAGEEDFFTVNYDRGVVYRASERGVAYRLVRVEMGSPLTVLLEYPKELVVPTLLSIVLLAERICTFKPRVSAKRKEWMVKEAQADLETLRIKAAQADVHAPSLREAGPRLGEGPSQFEVIDADDSEDLVEVTSGILEDAGD
jgi:hypothetical protein